MTKIAINPEATYDLAQKLKNSNNYFIDILRAVYGPYKNLDLEIRSKPQLEYLINTAIKLNLANDIYKLGARVEEITNKFIETDRNLAENIAVNVFDNYLNRQRLYDFDPKDVPTEDKDNNYPRGEGKFKSNCTWYAAEALHKYSNIDIERFHNMGANNAKTWGHAAYSATNNPRYNDLRIKSVDQIPEPGSIYCDPKRWEEGHVAFVETVIKNNNGGYKIIVSEEDYYAKTYWKKGKDGKIPGIIPFDDNTVYRREREIDIPPPDNSTNFDPKETDYSFIHFNLKQDSQNYSSTKVDLDLDKSNEVDSSAKLK